MSHLKNFISEQHLARREVGPLVSRIEAIPIGGRKAGGHAEADV